MMQVHILGLMNYHVRKFHSQIRGFRRLGKKNLFFLGATIAIFLVGVFFFWISTFQLPNLDASFVDRKVVSSTKLFDKTGKILLYDVNQDIRRTVVPFDQISRNVKNASIAIEDREFYQHNGIQIKSILRAIFANTTTLGYSQGGSTITQQVVKNSLLSKEKILSRKIKEWVLATKLEKVLTKDEILAMYLNESPYGGSIYGVEEASQVYFGKKALELTVAESAYLAALPQAPTYFSPFGTHKDKLDERKNLVVQEMLRDGFITQEEADTAKTEVVVFKPRQTEGIKAPHFVFYVIDQLNKKYGEDVVRNEGLRVITTLDYELQQKGEEIAKRNALTNKIKFNAENAAFVVLDPKTGGILSMIGSRDYFDKVIDGNFNASISPNRQPGSTFKPFVYAQAFIKGYTPETVLFDAKTQFSTNCLPENLTSTDGCYSPDNYDMKNRGPLTLRESLAQSINVTSVKTLYLAGLRESLSLAKKMGIESLKGPEQYGLTLVLGGGEVSLLEITGAYTVFANEGIKNTPFSIQEVKDINGTPLESWKVNSREVLPREVALTISSILSDNVARTPAFGQSSLLSFTNRDVAVKTGTTNDYRDAWIIGYTPQVTLGAWVGNNNNSPMEKKVAGFIVAPMWREYMDEILKYIPSDPFPVPQKEDSYSLKPVLRGKWQGGIGHLIDTVSGQNATEFTPKESTQELLSGGIHSILFWLNKDNPRGAEPGNPNSEPQYKYWEYGVNRWLQENNIIQPTDPILPQGYDTVHTNTNIPTISIINPTKEMILDFNKSTEILVTVQGIFPIKKVEYYINNISVGESVNPPFSIQITPKNISSLLNTNTLRAVVYDSVYNNSQSEVVFSVNLP